MIHEAYMPVYMGSRFLAQDGRDGTGRTEVVQEALADLKISIYNIEKSEALPNVSSKVVQRHVNDSLLWLSCISACMAEQWT